MRTLPLGNSGVDVSAMCLGAMYFGSRTDKAKSYTLLDQYVDAGGRFLDTANIYARWIPGFKGGESETLLGQWMRERKNRDQLFIASKVGFEYPDVERGLPAWRIQEECEKSLKRMGIETIDLYYAHKDDRDTPLEETMEAFDKLIQAGKVRYVATSNMVAWRVEEARWTSRTNGWAEYCGVQQRYSYLRPQPGASFGNQTAANDDLLDYCAARGITLLAYSPLLSGCYTRADRPIPDQYAGPDSDARMAALKAVAKDVGATANQVVFAWMLHSTPPVIPVFGASTPEQMAENLGALDVKLSDAHMDRLNQAGA